MRHVMTIALSALTIISTGVTRASAAPYTLTTISVPGATATYAAGINNAGQVTGGFTDATGSHGFIDTNGAFTTLNAPGSFSTGAAGINNAGQVVGTYSNNSGQHGFVYNNGAYTTLDIGGSSSTVLTGINDVGQVIGLYINASGYQQGFILANGALTLVTVPNSQTGTTQVSGINNAGQVVGTYSSAQNSSGFLDTNGVFTTINVPTSLMGHTGTFPFSYTLVYGINDLGQITGVYADAAGRHNFVATNGAFTAFDAPGVSAEHTLTPFTTASGINDAGQVVGSYDNTMGSFSFVANPTGGIAVPEPPAAAVLAGGVAFLALIGHRRRNSPEQS